MSEGGSNYESAALARRLNAEQKLEVIELFAQVRDVNKVAVKLDLPIKLVRRTLNNPKLADYARTMVGLTVGMEFYGEALELALTCMKDDKAKYSERLQSLKFIHGVLEPRVTAKPVGRPKTKPEEKDEMSFAEEVAALAASSEEQGEVVAGAA